MNRLLLILVLIALLLLTNGHNPIVQITIVVPSGLLPYYEWLLEFPGWPPNPPLPAIPAPIETHGYQTVTPCHRSVAAQTLIQHK